jgi:hypothetical protein
VKLKLIALFKDYCSLHGTTGLWERANAMYGLLAYWATSSYYKWYTDSCGEHNITALVDDGDNLCRREGAGCTVTHNTSSLKSSL